MEDPDTMADEVDKFIKKSLFRKMAQVQDPELVPRPTPIHEDPLTWYVQCLNFRKISSAFCASPHFEYISIKVFPTLRSISMPFLSQYE